MRVLAQSTVTDDDRITHILSDVKLMEPLRLAGFQMLVQRIAGALAEVRAEERKQAEPDYADLMPVAAERGA